MENTFYQNTTINNINTDSAVSQILSYFDPFYILSVTTDSFNMRFRPYQLPMPNLVSAYEERYKMIVDQFPNSQEIAYSKREEIYTTILNTICNCYNLSLIKENITEDNQYALAYILYQVLFSDFTNSLINLFVNYIEKEKNGIFNFITPMVENNDGVADKSIKNTTTSLNKKTYTDNKIAVIQGFISYVLDMISSNELEFNNVIALVVQNPNYVNLINSCVEDKGDIFKNYFCSFLVDPDTRPILITLIKLKIHDMYLEKNKIENYMNKERK